MKHLDEVIGAVNEKETLRLSILHKLMLDFFDNCDEEKKINLLDSLKDKIPEFIHTPDGAKLAIKLIWFAPVKERKLIVKNFKDLSVKAAMEHYGHRVLLALFDTVDDTVLLNKVIVSELANEMKKLIEDDWGEKVIHYLVHPRDGRGIDKREITFLAEGDSNPHSKKTQKDRYGQLYAGITENLYPYLAANFEELVFEANKSKFVAACLETACKFKSCTIIKNSSFFQQASICSIDKSQQKLARVATKRSLNWRRRTLYQWTRKASTLLNTNRAISFSWQSCAVMPLYQKMNVCQLHWQKDLRASSLARG